MSMKSLESSILWELREITGKRTLRMKDVMEWSTGPVTAAENETLFVVPRYGVNCAVLTSALPKPKKPEASHAAI